MSEHKKVKIKATLKWMPRHEDGGTLRPTVRSPRLTAVVGYC